MDTHIPTAMRDERIGAYARRPRVLLLVVPLVATILVAVIRGSRHFAWDWPTHAHHHLVAHITAAVGLAVVGLLVVFWSLRRGERWASWALAVVGIAIFGGYWAGNLTVGLGIEAALPNTAQAVLTVTYTLGLVLSRAGTRPGHDPRAPIPADDRRAVGV